MVGLKKLYLLTPVMIALASFRLFDALRAAELVILPILFYAAIRLVRFPKVSRVTFLYILLCIMFAFVGVANATATGISFSLRTILALSLFHFFFCMPTSFSENIDYRKMVLVLTTTYLLGIYSYFWEFSFIFCCFVVIFFNERKYLWVLISIFLVFIVGQRAPFVALFLYISYRSLLGFSLAKIVAAILLVSTAVLASTYIPAVSENRVVVTMLSLNPSNIIEAWKIGITEAETSTYEQFVYEDRFSLTGDGDLSAHLRIRKWAKAYTDFHGAAFFIGLGPDYFGKGADSGLIRLFFSFGFIVFAMFIYYIYVLSRTLVVTGRALVFILMACNLFLDLTFSVVVMSFFGILMSGYKKKIDDQTP